MTILKSLFTFSLLATCLSAFSQSADSTVFLKWKLKPGEVLTYQTVMKDIDTANHEDFAIEGMIKAMGEVDKEKIAELNKVFKDLNKSINADFITKLSEKKKGIIDVAVSFKKEDGSGADPKPNSDDKGEEMKRMLEQMTNGVVLRGSLNEDGTIESFYTKSDQKNLLAVFFELPGKPVKVGDNWSLDVHLISMDQNFICDSSSHKNNVRVTGISAKNGDNIVTMQYNVEEFVVGDFISPIDHSKIRSSMKFTFKGISDFSLEKGRWIDYNGIMTMASSGVMTSQDAKSFSLIPQ